MYDVRCTIEKFARVARGFGEAVANGVLAFFLAPEQGSRVQCETMSIRGICKFYRDGFQRMTLGRTLWCIILLKLVIIFVVLRVFFMTPYLQGTDEQKSRAVAEELTNRN